MKICSGYWKTNTHPEIIFQDGQNCPLCHSLTLCNRLENEAMDLRAKIIEIEKPESSTRDSTRLKEGVRFDAHQFVIGISRDLNSIKDEWAKIDVDDRRRFIKKWTEALLEDMREFL